jgi:uncharacterized membrane protein YcaP (DUF421 family)
MWFSTWSDLTRILLVGAAAYVTLVVILRTSGKRTLAKLNAFDLVVTVALGSTLAGLTTRFGGRAVVTANPTLLVERGRIVESALRPQRVTESEVLQAVRSSGVGDIGMVAAAVLETDGTISVITQQQAGNGTALRNVPDVAME